MSGYIGTQPVPQATQTRDSFTATANQTSFATSGYTPEFLDVFLNGVKLAAADYTATNGSDVVLASGAAVNDILEVVAYSTFEVLNPTFDGNVTFTGNASFGDNDKAIFGDGSDLQIYHSGSDSWIEDNGTGNLYIDTNGAGINLSYNNSAENMATFTANGAVQLYYNNASKLATTSTGINVTGTVNAVKADIDISTNARLTINDIISEVGDGNVALQAQNSAGSALKPMGFRAEDIRFATGSTERMRLDSSGNLLVGKASSSIATDGAEFNNGGHVSFTRNNDTPVFLNRRTSDGSIIDFRKDNSTIGSISIKSGDLVIHSSTTDHVGLMFGNTRIEPTNNYGTTSDNTVDLGNTDRRFKDAYLSGGIYLGGTGSANKLDDYEEGTWTPTLIAVSGGAITFSGSTVGIYTKIGRLVHISFSVDNFSVSGGTGGATINIGGLPFTTQGSGIDSNGAVLGSYNINWSRTDFVAVRTYAASTLGFLVSNNNGTWMWENINAFSSGSGKYLNGTITYMTTQ